MAFPEKIWSYYEGEGIEAFSAAKPRLDYLFRQVEKRAGRAASILNVGIGDGYFEGRCQQAGFRICAIDPVEAAVKSLRSKGIDARTALLSALPFPAGQFDMVVASEVLEHLDDQELRAGVAEVGRVLKPGGVFLGTVPYQENLSESMVVCPDCGKRFHRWGHMQSFNFQTLPTTLAPPLALVSMKARYFSPGLTWRSKVSRTARQLLLSLGSHGINENIVFVFAKRV